MRTFKIAGETVQVSPNWNISSKLNQRTTANITVIDLGNLTGINEGDAIEIYNDATKIFAGLVYSIRIYEAIPNQLYYDIAAVDNSALADRRLVAAVAEDLSAGDVIRSVILPVLTTEGVTEGVIQDGVTIAKSVFNYIKCSEALDQLKDITGFNWKIDNEKKLHFFGRDTNTAPFVLNNSFPHSGFEKNSAMGNYRNRQYVRGSQGETAVQQLEKPSPLPDGQIQSFTLRLPLAKKPSIFVNSIQVDEGDIGINGIDTGKKWYFSYNSNTINQDSTESPLGSTDTLQVTYIGLRKLLLCIENTAGIADRREKEGTSGIYENISNEQTIKSTDQAVQYANGLIQKYGEINDTISFVTTVDGLEAGQLLRVQKPLFGIDASFLIDSVNISGWDADTIEYQVNALDGASLGGWEQFFKEIIRDNRDFTISEDEVIITINTFSETETYTGYAEIKVLSCLYPSETLYPAETLFVGTLTSTTTKYD